MAKHSNWRLYRLSLIGLLVLTGCSGLLPFGEKATNTPVPTRTPSTTATPTPTVTPPPPADTPVSVDTPLPTPTLEPTETPPDCWKAAFIADGTIPDGTWIKPGATFTKVWRVRNEGVCTWQGVVLEVAEGDPMGNPTIMLPEVVSGETVDITAVLTAPLVEGDYRTVWHYRAGDATFNMVTVVIKVTQGEPRPGLIPPLPTLPPLPPIIPLPTLPNLLNPW